MPNISDESVQNKTGKRWEEWFAILDNAGAKDLDHKRIAGWLATKHGLSGWWSQTVAVEYERARGKRGYGETKKGYEASVQRTIAANPAKVARILRENIPELKGVRKTARQGMDVYRVALDEGRLEIFVAPKPPDRTVVIAVHTQLKNASARTKAKARWTKTLDAVKAASTK